jgi:hypothetical protein
VAGKVKIRPASSLTQEERTEMRRVRGEVYELLRKDEDRRRGGEGNVRDEGEAFGMARRIMNGRGAA